MNRAERRRRKSIKGGAIIGPITPEGKRALESGNPTFGGRRLTPLQWLLAEIIDRTGGNISQDHCTNLMQQVVAHFGSIDAALAAVRAGDVGFQPTADLSIDKLAADLGQSVDETFDAMKELEKHGFAQDDGEGRYWLTMPGEDLRKRMKKPFGVLRYTRNH